jgi:hypothetical protein
MPNPVENPMLESTLVTPDHGDTTTIPIMITGAVIVCLTICCITAVVCLRPTMDNTQLITTMVGFATVSVTSLSAFLRGNANSRDIRQLHFAVNSRLTQLLQATASNATLVASQRQDGVTPSIPVPSLPGTVTSTITTTTTPEGTTKAIAPKENI